MKFSFSKEDVVPISICALTLGPSINFYLNDIIQYVYGGSSVSAVVYIILAIFGIRAYPILFKKQRITRNAKNTIVITLAVLLLSFIVHPSIGELLIAPDFNPLRSIFLFLLFFGFPLMIYCSLDNNWDRLLKFLFYVSIVDIVLAGLDYSWVMLRISLDDVNYMSFSYNQLLAASVCAVYGYKEKKIIPYLLSFASLVLIFFGGARGPMGCLLILYFLMLAYPFSVKKTFILIGVGAIVIIGGSLLLNRFLSSAANVISDIGGFSRTLYKITEGDLLQSNGRENISNIIESAISSNPIGYGLLGDRYVLMQHGLTGYAHSIILEFLCDFGWLMGPILFVVWSLSIIKLYINKNKRDSYYCFLAMLPAGCLMLFLSGSFVEEFVFWALLGIIFNSKKTTTHKIATS